MNEEKIEQKLDQLLAGQAKHQESMAQLQQSHADLLAQVREHHVTLYGTGTDDGLRARLTKLQEAHNFRQSLCIPPPWWKVAGTAVLVIVLSYAAIAILAFWLYMAVIHGKRP